MKKILYLLTIALAVFSSCKKSEPDEILPEGKAKLSIEATLPDGSVWDAAAVIAVYDGLDVLEIELKSGDGTSTAKFEGIVDGLATDFQAVYPSSAAVLKYEELIADIPSVQNVTGAVGLIASARFSKSDRKVDFALSGKQVSVAVPSGCGKYLLHSSDGSFIAGTSKTLELVLPNTQGGTFGATINSDANIEVINEFAEIGGTYFVDGKEIIAISSKDDFLAFCASPSSEKDVYFFSDINLESNGDTDSEGFVHIPEFKGVIDGQGCSIYNIFRHFASNESKDTAWGLVGTLDGGTIRNLNLGTVDGENWDEKSGFQFEKHMGVLYGGSFVGEMMNGALVENCKNFLYVMPCGKNEVYVNKIGGIAGRASGTPCTIRNCYNDLEVRDNDPVKSGIGCIAGILGIDDAGSTIEGCENHAEIIPNNSSCRMVGGIVGCQNAGGLITKCKNTGKLNDGLNYTAKPYLGGIAGYQTGTGAQIVECENAGEIFCTPAQIAASNETLVHSLGGIVGAGDGVISNCINNGSVTFQHKGSANRGVVKIGGIMGGDLIPARIDGCTNNAAISASKHNNTSYIGGILGRLESTAGKVGNCTNTGKVYTNRGVAGSCLGGIVGEINNDNIYPVSGFYNCCVDCEVVMDNSAATYQKAGMLVGACNNPGSAFPVTFGKEGEEAKYKGKWYGAPVSASAPHLIGASSPGTEIVFVAKYQE